MKFLVAQRRKFAVAAIVALMAVASAFASASSIAFDANVLIDQINTWIPIFLPILGIGLAISIAIALVEKVGGSILNAFRK